MTTGHRRLTLFLPLFLLPGGLLYAQQNRVTARIDSARTVVLTGHVHPRATPQNDRGAVEGTLPLTMTLVLRSTPAQQADLDQLLAQQHDPASSSYHQWLTPEQYADSFGVSASDLAAIAAWLESQGFTVSNVARSRTWITFSGTAAQAQPAFRTEIHRYNVGGSLHYANATDPSIPAALAGVVAVIRGLNDFRMQPRIRKPVLPEMTTLGGSHHIAPDDFATIYNVAPLYQAGVDGTGQTIAVVGQTAIHTSDIQSFNSQFNLGPPNLQQVLIPGSRNPGVVSGDDDEANLDIEWSGAVARKATILYVYSTDVWQSATYAVDQNLAPVLSMSYGACEPQDLVDLPSERALVQQANAQGMTWVVAAGDSGAADCSDPDAVIAQTGLAVDVPAAIPEVTAMGGTEFNEQGGAYWSNSNTANGASALSYIPERVWNDNSAAGFSSTGGGASGYFPRPTWQTGPGVPNDGARHVPDLALASSAQHDGYAFFSGGSAGYVGGTSAAAPTMAGIFALVNQYLVSTGIQRQPGLGNANPALYSLAQNTTGVFHDVVTGDNTVPCAAGSPDCTTGTMGFSAGPAYDQATGWGSVDAFSLVHQWSTHPVLTSSVVPSLDQNPIFQQGSKWPFQLTLTEEAGIPTTLTGMTIDGASYSAQILGLFGKAAIPAGGSITASLSLSLAAPKTVVLVFTGVDASGLTWTTQLSVPFSGPQVRIAIGGISNAATGQQVYAPGMILSVYGLQMGSFAQSALAIPLPLYMAGFEAWVNGVATPLYYVSPNQVNLQIPYETQPGRAVLEIDNPYENITYSFTVSPAGPGIFTLPDGSINPFPKGARGQTITLFITGEGQVSPALATGTTPSPRTDVTQLPKPRLPVTVTVGAVQANIAFIGIPSGLVGVTQINYTVPDTAPLGVQQVVVTVGSASSPPATLTVTQ